MKTMYYNAKLLTPEASGKSALLTENGKILALGDRFDVPDAEKVDCGGRYLAPGFADIHVHGGGGYSAMSDDPADIAAMCRAHLRYGVTSIVPTALAAPIPRLKRMAQTVNKAMRLCTDVNILGVHFEGPFLSPAKAGAQQPENLLLPTEERIAQLLDCAENIRMIGAAPELPGGADVGKEAVKRGIVASVAHSDASFETAEQALGYGFSDITHIFSACSAMHKEGIFRQVGVAEAGLALEGYTAQFIGDLRHLPRGAVKLIYRCKGADKAYLISDGLEFAAADLPDGTAVRQENGQEAIIEDGVMKLKDRSCLAGSVTPVGKMVKNMLLCGIPLPDAVKMASETPLRIVGFGDRKGKLRPGFDADLVLFDGEIRVTQAIVGGRTAFKTS